MSFRNLVVIGIFVIFCNFESFAAAQAKQASIPFSNVILQPNEKLYVDYQLTAQYPSLTCVVEPSAIFDVDWEYKGTAQQSAMNSHEVTLTFDDNLLQSKTHLADKKGTLVITNLIVWGPTQDGVGFAKCVYNYK